ncbi:DUF2339 domain-containing protein [Ferribacterium limneticum]|uniref:hypothetical protein n=1 Tax=Ferribacterium limneticum TaxID=76259 RepID=UPI001CFBEB50|nr:hypothetical protein [Ferribacterium limneticum]UCV27928.1 hypothetical protein KI617_17035 [Ferribacterium limneticum]UCV31845.1 hypothetical protein KI608_17035 [Ferribacterium limneticum]
MLPGKIATLLVISAILSVIGALLVAWRYRVAMQALMTAPLAAPSTGQAAPSRPLPCTADAPARPVSLADNRRAERQLIVAFLGITLVMSLARTLLMQVLANGPITIITVSTLCAAYAWPVVPVVAIIRRWSRRRFATSLLLWFVAAVALLSWRTTEDVQFIQVLKWMSFDIGLPLVVVSALCLGSATRAVAPWLAPLFFLLAWASLTGIDVLEALVGSNSPIAFWLASLFGAVTAIVLFAFAFVFIAWWPARALGRWLGRAYAARQISELFYLFSAVWVIALTGPALGAIASEGWRALLYFLPLICIPFGARLMQATTGQRQPGRPPTLLVLRVFQQDANVQDLFNRVIERWRLTGNTVLIAGTDLLTHTTDPDDIFTFLDGRLAERFIHSPADVPRRIAAFEWQPDVEGRYRVNECYCHDTTWQLALAELLRVSDVVLMDLRNFIAANKGCLYELETLSSAPGLNRVVVLVNDRTELAAAQAATAKAPASRFVWVPQQGDTPPATEQVLAPLLGTPSN